jgi:endonuclease YncB( thermonuclease family)
MAKEFTQDALKDGFSVRTRWQGVFSGKPNARKYGIVRVGGRDLAELLVAKGLARIHGMGIGGQTWDEVERLKGLEAEAKKVGKGAWGLASKG